MSFIISRIKTLRHNSRKLLLEQNFFSHCFKDGKSLPKQIENWQKVLKAHCHKAFRKVRIRKKKFQPANAAISKLIDNRNQLLNDGENDDIVNKIDVEIAEKEAEENRLIIVENFKPLADNPDQINLQQMWRLHAKLWPKTGNALPIAKKNHKGKIVSAPGDIKKVLAKEYKDRLRLRPLRPDLKNMKIRRKRIFQMKMKLAKSRKSPDWTMADLEKALANLKNNKARDYDGYINEIFKLNVIGDDLKLSLLLMLNNLKAKQMIPNLMNITNITTVPKQGSLLEPKNERGIFRVSVVRYILMRVIYNMKYPIIDGNISDCQMGARKKKGCKNNIFIINGIIHEVLKSKKMAPVLLQIYDYQQMFDSINLQQALSDIYDAGVNDDTLALLHEANHEIQMSVKTANGLTDRQTIKDIVLQADTFRSILASVQVDSIGKECMAAGHGYKYKNKLPVGFLGLVDDIIGVTEAGLSAHKLNAFINVKTAEKTLQFGSKKCKSMLIGKSTEHIINSELMVDSWKIEYDSSDDIIETYNGQVPIEQTHEQKYLGFVLSSTGDNMANIRQVEKKSIGIVRKIIKRLNALNLNKYYFECALILMNSMLKPSILYACEMYYNLKEFEIRHIEKIEEGYLRKVMNTSRGCPISQLYLEFGHQPARFEIQKMRLLYFKYILEESEDSLLRKFLKLQLDEPTRGDWASRCLIDLKELRISEPLTEIKKMTKTKFTNILKTSLAENALQYLREKQKSKGKEIEYSRIEMAEYLDPGNENLTIVDKQKLFSIRNRMVEIESNFPKKEGKAKCVCGKEEEMKHLYICETLNGEDKPNESYENIYNGNIHQQTKVFRKFEQNFEIYEKMKKTKMENQPPCDPLRDPLFV